MIYNALYSSALWSWKESPQSGEQQGLSVRRGGQRQANLVAGGSITMRRRGKRGSEFSVPRESYTHISINTQDSNSSRWPRDYSPSIPTPLLPQTGRWSFACVPVIPAQCRVVCWPGLFSPTVHSNGNPVANKTITFTPGLRYNLHYLYELQFTGSNLTLSPWHDQQPAWVNCFYLLVRQYNLF